jgi:hypothetical protein
MTRNQANITILLLTLALCCGMGLIFKSTPVESSNLFIGERHHKINNQHYKCTYDVNEVVCQQYFTNQPELI